MSKHYSSQVWFEEESHQSRMEDKVFKAGGSTGGGSLPSIKTNVNKGQIHIKTPPVKKDIKEVIHIKTPPVKLDVRPAPPVKKTDNTGVIHIKTPPVKKDDISVKIADNKKLKWQGDNQKSIDFIHIGIEKKPKGFPALQKNMTSDSNIISVESTVFANTGEPLPNATITVAGKGATSNENGYFKINADKNAMLEIRFMGFQAKKIKASDVSEKITLQEDIEELDGFLLNAKKSFKKPLLIGGAAIILGALMLSSRKKKSKKNITVKVKI